MVVVVAMQQYSSSPATAESLLLLTKMAANVFSLHVFQGLESCFRSDFARFPTASNRKLAAADVAPAGENGLVPESLKHAFCQRKSATLVYPKVFRSGLAIAELIARCVAREIEKVSWIGSEEILIVVVVRCGFLRWFAVFPEVVDKITISTNIEDIQNAFEERSFSNSALVSSFTG